MTATDKDLAQAQAEHQAAIRQQVRQARDRRRRWRHIRRRTRRLLPLVALLVLAILALGAWAGWSARSEMLAGRIAMQQGRAALLRGDTQGALVGFDNAKGAFAAAEHRLTRPYVRPLEVLPALGANLRAARMLAGAGTLLADAGAEVGARDGGSA